ncbi:MAG: aromatic ring-hydroxylating dioxygenase subunit alpha [Betaproteobacteria bacterium]|nr:aromatic ring-hydroxylating dioxygenase subunit alpha [Betaproteobacteria bacterium]
MPITCPEVDVYASEQLYWHPVCDAAQLTDAPLSVQLLSQALVLWRDQQGKPHGLHDKCPHRGARLSLGRVCQGALQCPYHGWTFDGAGQCLRVPAMPDFKPGTGQQTKALAVQEAYGLVWVCLHTESGTALTTTTQVLPAFEAEAHSGMRKLNAGPYVVATSAPRIVENFLDMAHFSFVHEGWLGDAQHSEIPDYQVAATPLGFKLLNAQAWQPRANALSTQSALVAYTYQVSHPYAAVLTKLPDPASGAKAGYEESIALFIQPIEPDISRVWFRLALADFQVAAAQVLDFQNTIFMQDKPVLESQRPRLLPLQPGAESHVAVDKGSVSYRRYLQAQGITFGVC